MLNIPNQEKVKCCKKTTHITTTTTALCLPASVGVNIDIQQSVRLQRRFIQLKS